jgi:hypothetical protein
MPVNKFISIIKQKIDIIDNVPVCVDYDLEANNSFRINVVSNDGINKINNKKNLLNSSDNLESISFKNQTDDIVTQDNKDNISKK